MGQPPNKKVPESAAQTKAVAHPVYLHMITDVLGRMITTHANPNKPNDAFHSTVNHDGSFHTEEKSDSHKGLRTSHTHHERSNAGSSSKNNDGPVDSSAQGTKNSNVKGDSGGAVGGTSYKGAKKEIGGTAEGTMSTVPGAKTYVHSGGDRIYKLDKNCDTHIDGDDTSTVMGSKIDAVYKDIGLVSVTKNISFKSQKGRIKIEAAEAIELVVGNSYITIVPGGIEIGTDGFINVLVNKGSQNLSIINYGSGRAQMGTNGGEATIAGNSIVLKSKTGTTIEKGPTIPPLPWGGVTK